MRLITNVCNLQMNNVFDLRTYDLNDENIQIIRTEMLKPFAQYLIICNITIILVDCIKELNENIKSKLLDIFIYVKYFADEYSYDNMMVN